MRTLTSERRLLAAVTAAAVLVAIAPIATAEASPARAPATPPAAVADRAGEELPDYDARAVAGNRVAGVPRDAAARSAATAGSPAVTSLRAELGQQGLVDIDRYTGTPRLVARLDGFLTGPSSKAPATVALDYLRAHAGVFGLDAAVGAGLTLRKDYVDIEGTHHLSFVQSVAGVPVFGNGVKAHVSRTGQLIQVDGSPLPRLPASPGTATLSATDARAAAVKDVFGTSKSAVTGQSGDAARVTTFTDGGQAQLVLFQSPEGPRLAWQTIVPDEGFLHVVDAKTGRVLLRRSLVSDHSASTWDTHPGAAVGGTAVRRDLTAPGWLAPDAPTLSGNVAHVYTDVDNNNKAGASEEVVPNGPESFEYPFTDFTAEVGGRCSAQYPCSWNPAVPRSWQVNRAQTAAQLFYFLGTFHDHLAAAPIGFTPAAGNFEAAGGDAVQGEALNGADLANGLPNAANRNNAFMFTPRDGIAPRMQMFLWYNAGNPANPALPTSSADVADVVYHEYTHGLSHRLVVDATGEAALDGAQAGAMGEAISDFYAFDYLVAKNLVADTAAVGELKLAASLRGGTNLRSQPMDCPVGDTSTACGGTATAGAGGYTYGDFGRVVASGAQVHADGEIFSQTLWDLRRALGSPTVQSLLTRGMELAPVNPTFLDLRNAILRADQVVNSGRDHRAIWSVFAARGMGWYAGAVDSGDTAPAEDFSTPPKATGPYARLVGTVTDVDTGRPVAGAVVSFTGHTSGLGGGYTAVTGADGTYVIAGVRTGKYGKVVASGGPGYESEVQAVQINRGTNTANWKIRRNWASAAGGATVAGSNNPGYPGCGPDKMIDQSAAGWSTEVVTSPDSAPFFVVALPGTIDDAQVVIDPSATCGDGASSATGDYRVETSGDGTAWTVAAEGRFGLADRGRMNTLTLAAGANNGVRFIRYTMLSSQVAESGGSCPGDFSGCDYVDSVELAVYGASR